MAFWHILYMIRDFTITYPSLQGSGTHLHGTVQFCHCHSSLAALFLKHGAIFTCHSCVTRISEVNQNLCSQDKDMPHNQEWIKKNKKKGKQTVGIIKSWMRNDSMKKVHCRNGKMFSQYRMKLILLEWFIRN